MGKLASSVFGVNPPRHFWSLHHQETPGQYKKTDAEEHGQGKSFVKFHNMRLRRCTGGIREDIVFVCNQRDDKHQCQQENSFLRPGPVAARRVFQALYRKSLHDTVIIQKPPALMHPINSDVQGRTRALRSLSSHNAVTRKRSIRDSNRSYSVSNELLFG